MRRERNLFLKQAELKMDIEGHRMKNHKWIQESNLSNPIHNKSTDLKN